MSTSIARRPGRLEHIFNIPRTEDSRRTYGRRRRRRRNRPGVNSCIMKFVRERSVPPGIPPQGGLSLWRPRPGCPTGSQSAHVQPEVCARRPSRDMESARARGSQAPSLSISIDREPSMHVHMYRNALLNTPGLGLPGRRPFVRIRITVRAWSHARALVRCPIASIGYRSR